MRLVNILIRIITIVVVVLYFSSCNGDANDVGSEVLGEVNFEDDLFVTSPIAYSKKLEKVQTTGLPNNLLGVYDDPIYGQSVYSVLSRVQLSSDSSFPEYGDNAVLDSVVISLPYFSTASETESVTITADFDGDGEEDEATEVATTYELDSVYNATAAMKLSVYKSNYFLRNFDPSSSETQLYYSDDIQQFGPEIEETLLYTIENFTPSAEEIVLTSSTDLDGDNQIEFSRTRVTPRLRINLSDNAETMALFNEMFLEKEGDPEFRNNNSFTNFFRGIYFKVESINDSGSLVYFDLSQADLTLHYTSEEENTADDDGDADTDTNEIIFTPGSLTLSFSDIIVNSIDTDLNANIVSELIETPQDSINGEASLYLKGGSGAYAVIDILSRMITDENGEEKTELEYIREQDWLINDARLKLYVDQDEVTGGDAEPERIYIFDTTTGSPLLDYFLDAEDSFDPVNSISDHLEVLTRDSDENGEFYIIKITQYILNLIENDDIENVQLGIAVSSNVNTTSISSGISTTLIDNTPTTTEEIIPSASIISHEGTVLYGNTDDVPESNRLTLDIFYTTTN